MSSISYHSKVTSAQMDEANRAKCWALRNPPAGIMKIKFKDIIDKKLVQKTDGTRPTRGSIEEAAKNFGKVKGAVGRPEGSRKTTKAEDRKIVDTLKRLRPPGHYVDSRRIHKALPKKLKDKIGRRTIRRRAAEKGFKAQKKLDKQAFAETQVKKRLIGLGFGFGFSLVFGCELGVGCGFGFGFGFGFGVGFGSVSVSVLVQVSGCRSRSRFRCRFGFQFGSGCGFGFGVGPR